MRQIRSWSLARRLFRVPAWAAALAGAFVVGAVVGPIAVSAQPTQGAAPQWRSPGLKHVFVIMMENTQYKALLSPANPNTKFIQQLAAKILGRGRWCAWCPFCGRGGGLGS